MLSIQGRGVGGREGGDRVRLEPWVLVGRVSERRTSSRLPRGSRESSQRHPGTRPRHPFLVSSWGEFCLSDQQIQANMS